MTDKFKVALLQLNAFGLDQKKNLEKGLEFCRKAKEMSADIVLFPEMWNIGYSSYKTSREKENWIKQAIGKEDDFVQRYQNLAKKLDMAIAITYLEKWPDNPRNTVSIIDRRGEMMLHYAKVHTCDFGMEVACTPGDDFYVCDLDTAKGLVKIGAMICFDREFPESARILMLKGAEIILVPNACDLEQNRLAQIQSRAFENMFGIAVANYAAPQFNGNSIAFDGIAFNKQGNSRNMLIAKAEQNEEICIAEFDLDKLRDYRAREVWGNAYRKPKTYGILVSETVSEPFIC